MGGAELRKSKWTNEDARTQGSFGFSPGLLVLFAICLWFSSNLKAYGRFRFLFCHLCIGIFVNGSGKNSLPCEGGNGWCPCVGLLWWSISFLSDAPAWACSFGQSRFLVCCPCVGLLLWSVSVLVWCPCVGELLLLCLVHYRLSGVMPRACFSLVSP